MRHSAASTCPFTLAGSCFAVSHALAVAVILAVSACGYGAFLYLACRPRAREAEEVIKPLRWRQA